MAGLAGGSFGVVTARVISIPTQDGALPAKLFAPSRPSPAAVIVYMDAVGWRDELDGMAARYASAGWLTLLPDLFHRRARRSFASPMPGAPLDPAMMEANRATSMEMTLADTRALMAWAEREEGISRFGVVGYCMGARHALNAAAGEPTRVPAAAMLHGGQLVRDDPGSPHLLIGRAPARLYFGFARDDETCPDEHQAMIERQIRATGADAVTERFAAHHGWTFPQRWCYDAAEAERAFDAVVALFRATLDAPLQATVSESSSR